MRDTSRKRYISVFDFDRYRTDPEAVGGGEGVAGGMGEGGDRGRTRGSDGGDCGGVWGGEEEVEIAAAEEVGGVDGVAGGEVGFRNNGHAEAPGEAAG